MSTVHVPDLEPKVVRCTAPFPPDAAEKMRVLINQVCREMSTDRLKRVAASVDYVLKPEFANPLDREPRSCRKHMLLGVQWAAFSTTLNNAVRLLLSHPHIEEVAVYIYDSARVPGPDYDAMLSAADGAAADSRG